MTSLVNYNPAKDIPTPRTGARGFTATTGSVFVDPNTPTPISDELLKELELDPTFQSLKKAGAITITTSSPPPASTQAQQSQPQDRVFDLPVPETEMTPPSDLTPPAEIKKPK